MSQAFASNVYSMRVGVLLGMVALLYGFGLGGAFGFAEEDIKAHLDAEGRAVLETTYGGSVEKMQGVTNKAWAYFKRAHLHANGLGATALVLMLLLALLPDPSRLRQVTALCLGAGALGYALFWMFAGLRAPGLGGTDAAKESLSWLAVPTAGLSILGVLLTIQAFVVRIVLAPRDAP